MSAWSFKNFIKNFKITNQLDGQLQMGKVLKENEN